MKGTQGGALLFGYIAHTKPEGFTLMSENKTKPTAQSPADFIKGLPEKQQADAQKLMEIMQKITGDAPVMWGGSIIGFGQVRYRYATGRSGETAKVAFSPRKGYFSLYLSYDAGDFAEELGQLGKHSHAKSCIYIKRLSDVDEQVLRRMIGKGYSMAADFDAKEGMA